jgi:hypothetical protein
MKDLRITIWIIAALLTVSAAALGGVTEVDTFANSWGQIDLLLPGGGFETIELYGPSQIHVFFEGGIEGIADDKAKWASIWIDEMRESCYFVVGK